MITKKCLICGKEFKIYPYRKNVAIFCSRKCYYLFSKGKHLSPNTEFKKGQIHWISGKNNPSAKNNPQIFQKGQTPWNKGIEYLAIQGNKHPQWKGGRHKNSQEYILIYSPFHPCRDQHRYVREHRLVAEQYLGRYLNQRERIHHINGIKTDNRPKNLYLFPTDSTHLKFHSLKIKPILQSNLL